MPKNTLYIEKDIDHRTNIRDDLRSDIADYYDQSYWDYRASWLNSKNLAIHYGYWSESTESHSDSLLEMNEVLAKQLDLKPGDCSGLMILDTNLGGKIHRTEVFNDNKTKNVQP